MVPGGVTLVVSRVGRDIFCLRIELPRRFCGRGILLCGRCVEIPSRDPQEMVATQMVSEEAGCPERHCGPPIGAGRNYKDKGQGVKGVFTGTPRDGEEGLKRCALFRQPGRPVVTSNWWFGASCERRFSSLKPAKSFVEDEGLMRA